MKRLICLFAVMLCVGIALRAQDKNEICQVELTSGINIMAYVNIMSDGNYKLSTEDGEEYYFAAKEIKKITRARENKKVESVQVASANLKYREYKQLYSARDYKYETSDKYNVGGITVASALLPGLGQYITGCQIGWGVLQTCMFVSGANTFFASPGYATLGLWGALWLSSAIWSACSANKAAKIKNMYLRDVRNGKAVAFTVDPYVDFCNGTFAMSGLQPVTGLSLKMSF